MRGHIWAHEHLTIWAHGRILLLRMAKTVSHKGQTQRKSTSFPRQKKYEDYQFEKGLSRIQLWMEPKIQLALRMRRLETGLSWSEMFRRMLDLDKQAHPKTELD